MFHPAAAFDIFLIFLVQLQPVSSSFLLPLAWRLFQQKWGGESQSKQIRLHFTVIHTGSIRSDMVLTMSQELRFSRSTEVRRSERLEDEQQTSGKCNKNQPAPSEWKWRRKWNSAWHWIVFVARRSFPSRNFITNYICVRYHIASVRSQWTDERKPSTGTTQFTR